MDSYNRLLSNHTNIDKNNKFTNQKSLQLKTNKPLIIGIVAGEVSGDHLGASFMHQMNNLRQDILWVGVGGAKMQAEGLQSLFPMSRLSVMGLVEVLLHLPNLLSAQQELLAAFHIAKIDWFIGIDAPDFNLRLAKLLKPRGIFCVQYVSPSIWAWRESRIHTIKSATNLVLCLFPFELEVYQRHQHSAICVGHPLLQSIPPQLLHIPLQQQRQDLNWQHTDTVKNFSQHYQKYNKVICLMPGSRKSEIRAILPIMLDAIEELLQFNTDIGFILPAVDAEQKQIIQKIIHQRSQLLYKTITVVYDSTQDNFSQKIMAAADFVVLASGTATLEAMLLNRPMIVVYRLHWLTFQIAKHLVKTPYVALPNILARQNIVPELIQDEATGKNLCQVIQLLLKSKVYRQQQSALIRTTQKLRKQSNHSVVEAIISEWYYQTTNNLIRK